MGFTEEAQERLKGPPLTAMRAIIILLLLITLTGYSQNLKYPRKGTINAYDEASKGLIDPLNVWEKKEQSSLGKVVAKVYHNEEVTMLKREGSRVYIETKGKVKGWITYWFIKEFQAEAKKDPLLN